jgi:AcrR family transcriptional regulator
MTTSRSAQIKPKNRKPGRPRKVPFAEGKTRDIKQDILDATVSLIAQFGFDGFVLRDVADAVGVHTALVGYYYKSKLQLEKAALDKQLSQLEKVFPLLKDAEDLEPIEAIKAIFLSLTKALEQGETSHRFNRWTLAKGGRYAEELSNRLYAPAVNLIALQFQKLIPEISPADSNARALMLFTFAENCANLRHQQMEYLKLSGSQKELLETYILFVERQLIPELCR